MKPILTLLVCLLLSANPLQAQIKAYQTPFILGHTDTISSAILGERRALNIYLPDGYVKDSSYPVIYLLDGSANEDFVHVVGIVQFLTMIEAMPKSIIVGIANVDRRRDFTFPSTVEKDRKLVPTGGGSSKFISFMEQELQPYIQHTYSASINTTIIGQSLGGLVATEMLIERPSLFSTYLIVSPSLWWDNESLLAKAKSLSIQPDKNIRVYIAVGNEGKQMEEDAKKLHTTLKATGNEQIRSSFTFMPDENHLTILHNCVYKALTELNSKK
ncbi:MAG: alpha/beta hydrolase-fold protein [Flavipsychrobacter sp.]|nr:alpha/beta hydrolase-fold protein [Flavipsychrobacter sp.]